MAVPQIDKTCRLDGIFAKLVREPDQMNFDFVGFNSSQTEQNNAARSLKQEDRRINVDWMHVRVTGQVSYD